MPEPEDREDREDRESPRLFVAVPLAEQARAAVAALVEGIKAELTERAPANRSEVRWVRMDGLHLTLRFLGPTPDDQVTRLREIVDELAGSARPFEVVIAGGGAFPSPGRPRTLWLGITDGAARLSELTTDLSARLEGLGWPAEERPFRAHMTLARSDGRREGPAAVRLLVARAADFRTAFQADRLILFESVTGGGPARYEPLHEARFGA